MTSHGCWRVNGLRGEDDGREDGHMMLLADAGTILREETVFNLWMTLSLPTDGVGEQCGLSAGQASPTRHRSFSSPVPGA